MDVHSSSRSRDHSKAPHEPQDKRPGMEEATRTESSDDVAVLSDQQDERVSAQPEEQTQVRQEVEEEAQEEHGTPPVLSPEIPDSNLSLDFFSGSSTTTFVVSDKIEKRRSNIMKLNEESEKLKRELKAMTERVEAAERRRAETQGRETRTD